MARNAHRVPISSPGLLKDRSRKPPIVESPSSEPGGSSVSPPAKDPPKRQRRVLDLTGLTQVQVPKATPNQSIPPPKCQQSDPLREVTHSQPTPTVLVDESSNMPSKGMGKKKTYEVEDPAYVPDMDFLRDIFVSTRENASLRSPAAESLASFSSDVFLAEDQSFIEFNRNMDHLVETRMSHEQLTNSNARICELERHLAGERKYSSEQESKVDELRKSERSFKDQVFLLSRQRDNLSKEVSSLKEEIMFLNEDLTAMDKDAAKVAKLTRKNAQDAKVQLFNDFCDSRGIPREPLDLEIFSDDEPVDDKTVHVDEDAEDTETDEDDEGTETDEDLKIEQNKGKTLLTIHTSNIPSSSSSHLEQPHGTNNVEDGSLDQELKEYGGGGTVPIQQRSSQP
ncbi:uncharacterized protein LOC113289575 isoform X1 [Papaver somniferum]|uniref:uncharacterized protein LOC113289575 isoform X1 n=1 Tax=Papaver somniferum TaxID=3469 RepID=UPI000E6F5743|nr:uncharacterized protein LOC113289575 isoform X1 [Papaver somniferum]